MEAAGPGAFAALRKRQGWWPYHDHDAFERPSI